jgi:hypothetical protein
MMVELEIPKMLHEQLSSKDAVLCKAAIDCLSELVNFGEFWDQIIRVSSPGGLQALLKDGNSDVIQSTFNYMAEITKRDLDDAWVEYIRGVVDITALLTTDEEAARQIAITRVLPEFTKYFPQFADHSSLRKTIIGPKLLETLLAYLDPENSDWQIRQISLRLFAEFAQHDDLRPTILASNPSRLWTSLNDKDEYVRLAALKCIATFVDDDGLWLTGFCSDAARSGDAAKSSDVAKSLQTLLEDNDPYIRELTLQILVDLSRYDDSRREIKTCGIPANLHVLLLDKEECVLLAAVRCVIALEEFADSRVEILDEAMLSSLRVLIKGNDQFIRQAVLECLKKFAKHDDSRGRLLELNTDLTTWLGNDDVELESISDYIAELASYEDSWKKLFCSKSNLEALLGCNNANIFQLTLDTILGIIGPGEQHLRTEIFELLSSLLENPGWRIRQVALDCISNLVQLKDLRYSIFASPKFRGLLEDGDGYVRLAALESISRSVEYGTLLPIREYPPPNGTPTDQLRREIVQVEAVENTNLLNLLNDKDPYIREVTIVLLTDLLQYDDSRKVLVDISFTQFLSPLFRDENECVRLAALSCATELAKYDDSKKDIMEADVLSVIKDLASDGDTSVSRAAVRWKETFG